jgi:hypothetical protein
MCLDIHLAACGVPELSTPAPRRIPFILPGRSETMISAIADCASEIPDGGLLHPVTRHPDS